MNPSQPEARRRGEAVAAVLARLDRLGDALAWPDAAPADRSSRLCEVATNPWFRHDHHDPAFRAFLTHVDTSRRLPATDI